MASMKDIKTRIKSVQSTMQITKAMELVASSKLRRAKERVENCRPYYSVLSRTLDEIANSNQGDFASVYLKKREAKKVCYIVFAGDRGLAGGYNSNMFKAIEADAAGKTCCVLPVGKKAVEYFTRRGYSLLSTGFSEAGDIHVSDCFEMSRLLCECFAKGDFDQIKVGYTRFVSMLSQTPVLEQLLPFVPQPVEGPRALVEYLPSSEEAFNAIIPEYLAGILYSAMCESVASEQGARRTAMDSASKNAAEMIDNLSLYYNRARQAAITQEITEIVSGSGQ